MILGIDPGGIKPHTIAAFSNGKLYEIEKSQDINRINWAIVKSTKVFIESQYYGGNPSTLILLSQRTGMLMGLCELHGIPYVMVHPKTWQSYFNIPKKPKGMTRYKWEKQHYQNIVDKAQEYTDIKIEDEDMGAAVLIGLWGVEKWIV